MRRGSKLLVLITIIVALPSAAALAWYYFTDDPTLRPLGITKSALDEHEEDQGVELVAQVQWDSVNDGQSSRRYSDALIQAFGIKGVDIRVELTDATGRGTSVTYIIGASTIGPFPKTQAVNGINAAIGAFQMNKRHKRKPIAN